MSTNAQRLQDIATAIYGAAAPVSLADQDKADAQSALDGAKKAADNQREIVLAKVAELSCVGGWTEPEIKAATKLAAKMGNALTDKSLATFIAETRRAAHPDACGYFPQLVKARDDAWDAEDALHKLDKDAPTPLRKAFSRRYHTLIRQLGEAADGGYILRTVDGLVDYAKANDPDLNIDKVFKRLQDIRDKLVEFASDFPDQDIRAAGELLSAVTKEDLTAARTKLQPAVIPTVVDDRATVETVADSSEELDAEAEDNEAEDAAGGPPAGAVDVWADLMAEAA